MRKNFLFGLLAIGLAVFGFGGVSLAANYTLTLVNNMDLVNDLEADAGNGNRKVILDTNGGVINYTEIDGLNCSQTGENYNCRIIHDNNTITLPLPVWESKGFSGWYESKYKPYSSGATMQGNTYTVPTSTKTLTAKWDVSAKIGNIFYDTFASAVANATDNDIITLLWTMDPYTMESTTQTFNVFKNGFSNPTVNAPEGPYVVNINTIEGGSNYSVVPATYTRTNVAGTVTQYKANFSNTSISSNGTYKLLTDLSVSLVIAPNGDDVTLDLNGHTLTSTSTDWGITLARKGTDAKHYKFSIINTNTDKGGKFVATGLSPEDSSDAIIMFDSRLGGNVTKYSDLTIGEGVTIEGGTITVFGDHNTLDIYGTVNGGGDFAIATNGSSTTNATINIHEGAVIESNITAMYLPGNTGLNVGIDGKVTGKTAVEIRGGELTIGENAELTANGEFSKAANGNGTTIDGAALAISQHTTNLPIDVTINGGILNGTYAIYEEDLEDEITEGVTLSVITGEFNGSVNSENIKNFIAGGIFSVQPSEDYIVAGKKAFPYGDHFKVATAWTVIFNPDNGDANIVVDVEDNTIVDQPETPINTGNILLGWYLNDNKFDFTTPITADITLTGKWEAISDSTGGVEAPEGDTFTGVILGPEEPALSESEETNITVLVASSNSTAEMEGVVELKVYSDYDGDGNLDAGDGDKLLTGKVNFTSPKVVRIPVNTTGDVVVKVRHTGQSGFSYDGLSASSAAICTGGKATPAYNGEPITPTSGYVEIWTCSASTFVAYTETQNQSSSSSSSSSGGGGGGSSRKTETKAETGSVATGDTAEADTTDTTGAEEGTSEETPVLSTAEEEAAVAKFGQEQIDAYKWALKNGITTMKTVDAARLDQPLTRAELAKMMVVYIQKVLEKDPAITGDVTYADVDENLGDLAGYIKLAYQYQIMGINANGTPIEAFNPNGLVTRGEYATVFSRVLFGDKFNKEGADFYTNHLSALEKAKILTNTTPTIQEIRGWVMLMMYRSSQNADDIQAVVAETEESTEETVSIANPAAEYCVAQGGESIIKTDKDGSQYGVCKLADGTEVDEWEYFRANNTEETTSESTEETAE